MKKIIKKGSVVKALMRASGLPFRSLLVAATGFYYTYYKYVWNLLPGSGSRRRGATTTTNVR